MLKYYKINWCFPRASTISNLLALLALFGLPARVGAATTPTANSTAGLLAVGQPMAYTHHAE